MNNVSFGAQINTNRDSINEKIKFDHYFDSSRKKNLNQVLNSVEDLSKMKENSIVTVTPRLNSNQLNLITKVTNSTGEIIKTINERYARKISTSSDFASKYIKHIQQSITNVEVTKNAMDKIHKLIKSSRTLIDNNFTQTLPQYIMSKLEEGYNPTQRILNILQKIEEEFANEKNILSIKTIKEYSPSLQKSKKNVTYFTIENSSGEQKILIQYLLKSPLMKIFG